MNDQINPVSPGEDDDPVLAGAGARLRHGSASISPATIELAVLRRRTRRVGMFAGASLVVVALLGGLLVKQSISNDGAEPETAAAFRRPGAPSASKVQNLLASLDAQPINPTKVQLVSTVSTFADCDALIGDLRQVGAQHVGSRGFGGFSRFTKVGLWVDDSFAAYSRVATTKQSSDATTAGGGDTVGTNVQVAGVDELDFVKAVGNLIYDLDGKGNLRITDAGSLQTLSTLDVTPSGKEVQVNELLVASGRAAILGTEFETSKPVKGDPSATRATTEFMTVTFVDATDTAAPKLTDRIRLEGSLVSARLVGGEIRLVTTSNMTDLGFVEPTTPNSVVKALDQNRRSVASSITADWIPDWQRNGEDPTPLVPCERVHVPDTFSGVAMTSMVTFPLGTGRFDPAGTSILAPATTLYAGLDKVAISSEVWVDPIDRDRLKFEDWQTAIHEFSFDDNAAPSYGGSGIVDGSTIGQFAFGEIGNSLAVVSTKGTPWKQQPKGGIDLTILTPDNKGGLAETSKIVDLANGKGEVSAVRFVEGRVLISTGLFGQQVDVIDVTKPDAPRRAGSVTVPGSVGYFHPLANNQALIIGSRFDEVGEGKNKRGRSWVQAHLLDVTNADAPRVLSSWERPWTADNVASDHHAFTYWPDRHLAMWGLQDTQQASNPNHAAVLNTEGGVKEVAFPAANKPNETPPPCPIVPITDPEQKRLLGSEGVVLRCGDKELKSVEWPRYQCYLIDDGTIARYSPGQEDAAAFFNCQLAPHPAVSRVLVVSGRPILLTDQTMEALDPQTFQSTSIKYHPSSGRYSNY